MWDRASMLRRCVLMVCPARCSGRTTCIVKLLNALPMDDRRGAEAWALLRSQRKPDQDDFSTMTIRSEWHNATIEKDVGYSINTITEWQRLLVGINAKLPPGDKYSENELR